MSEAPPAAGGWSIGRFTALLSRGDGRPVAGLLLGLSLVVLPFTGGTAYSLIPLAVFDLYQRIQPRELESLPVAIIDIDEASIARYGQWPWPRTLTARLVERVAALGPLVVAFDFIMSEPDRLSPSALISQYPGIDAALKRSLEALPSNDATLASVLERIPVVVGRAGLGTARPGTASEAPALTPFMVKGPDPTSRLIRFAGQLANVPEIERAASGSGLVNARPDADGVVRSVPLAMSVGGQAAPSLALEILRVALGAKWFMLLGDAAGLTGIQVGDSRFETDADGRVRLYFSPADPRRRYSAARVLAGDLPANALEGQVALIGITALGLADAPPTPVSSRMAGVEVQAQVIENLVDGTRLVRPAYARTVEGLALAVAGLIVIALLPRLRPSVATLLGAVILLVLFGGSFAAFAVKKQLFDPIFPALSVALIYLFLLSAILTESLRKRRALDAELERERLSSARMAGELDAARDIQMGMLPDPEAIEGLRAEIGLYATLQPAREVGGDLYDAFMIDGRRLFFLVGDVSGKGVPASLFMALSKALCKSIALRSTGSVTELMTEVNEHISRENSGLLFVTALAGVIDVDTGEGELCNAGHDAPLLLTPGEPPRELETVGGPPLCVVDDFPYVAEKFQMNRGDCLLLWTDGVSEAMTGEERMYGRERIVELLRGGDGFNHPREIVDGLYADVVRFMAGAEAYDDVTIMAIEYIGSSPA